MNKKRKFWRTTSIILVVLLALSVVLSVIDLYQVPHIITLFMFGFLVSIGIGNSILNPSTSSVLLKSKDEQKFRRRQVMAGFAVSLVLGFTFLAEEVRQSDLIYLFLPVIFLPLYLLFAITKKKNRG